MRSIVLVLFCALLSNAAEYRGKWTSARSGGGGEIRMQLEKDSDVVFTLDGSEVKAKVARSSSEGNALEIEFHFTIDGNDLKSIFKATRDSGKLTGKYVTSVRTDGSAVDGGSIELTESH